jgi:hypothetical protein
MNFKRTLTLLFIIALFLNQFALAQDKAWGNLSKDINFWRTRFENFLANLDIYNRAINYIQEEREAKDVVKLNLQETLVLFIVDLVLSLLSLWLAIFFMTEMKMVAAKKYLWFLFIWNVTWFVILILSKVSWGILDFLVISTRQDLSPLISINFPLILIIFTMLIYIWLLARSFSLNFFGALGVFITSHLVYFVMIFLILSSTRIFGPERLYLSARQGLSIRQVIRSYIMDSQKIAQRKDLLSLVRIKAFHL